MRVREAVRGQDLEESFGYHLLLCFLDATGEALARILRPANAGSDTAADHITVLDHVLAQIPDVHRYGDDILIRCDTAGASHAFLDPIGSLRERGVRSFFSVGSRSVAQAVPSRRLGRMDAWDWSS